jgi:hypothetical protein
MLLSDYPSRPDGEDKGLHPEEPPRQKDLLRSTVHLLLTVYLLPAIGLVILVGLIAVLADGWARALVWLAHQLPYGSSSTAQSGISRSSKELTHQ